MEKLLCCVFILLYAIRGFFNLRGAVNLVLNNDFLIYKVAFFETPCISMNADLITQSCGDVDIN